MATRRIREYLDGNGVHYQIVSHSPTCTAQKTAESAGVPIQYMAKNVIVWIDGKMVMAVVPATKEIDLEAIAKERHAEHVRLANETEFKNRFVGCQLGTVPPFGMLFGLETLCDTGLAYRPYIAFPAGTHTDVILMKFSDYDRLIRPLSIPMAMEPLATMVSNVPQL